MKILHLILGICVAWFVSAGCVASDGRADEAVQASTAPEASDGVPEPGVEPIAIPDELQPITNADCRASGNSCVSRNLCIANDGQQVSGTGCASGQICCRFNPCLNAGLSCATAQLCNANGTRVALSGCPTGRVCCRF